MEKKIFLRDVKNFYGHRFLHFLFFEKYFYISKMDKNKCPKSKFRKNFWKKIKNLNKKFN